MRLIVFQHEKVPNISRVIGFICTEVLFGIWPFHHKGKDKILNAPFVMAIGSRNQNCQRRTPFVDQDVELATSLAAICGVASCISTTQWCRAVLAINRLPFPADFSFLIIETDHLCHHLLKDALFLPLLKRAWAALLETPNAALGNAFH
ncbi:MAG: hypothetical protein R2932_04800 [Caldilineaceae bacterium]